jgi:hypothetical protein
MPPEHEKHFKKPPIKPWVLELTINWPNKWHLIGKVSVWKYRYATKQAAQQAEPMQLRFWEQHKIPVISKIYKK